MFYDFYETEYLAMTKSGPNICWHSVYLNTYKWDPGGTVWCSGADQQGCLEAHHTEEVCESNDRDLALATQTTERMCDTGMGVVASIISCLLLITIYILDLTELKIVNIEWKVSLLIHQALAQGDHDDQQRDEHHYNHYLHDRQVTKEQDDYHIKD